jgi:hypothetical protein
MLKEVFGEKRRPGKKEKTSTMETKNNRTNALSYETPTKYEPEILDLKYTSQVSVIHSGKAT